MIYFLTVEFPRREYFMRYFKNVKLPPISEFKFHTYGYLQWTRFEDKPYYKSCPAKNCSRKVVETLKGYECRNCLQYYEDFMPAYSLNGVVSDFSDQIHVQFYRSIGEALIGQTAESLLQLKQKMDYYSSNDESKLKFIYEKKNFKPLTLELSVSYTSS